MHCKKCCKISLINFKWHLSCLQNLILQQIFYSVRAKICTCTSKLSVFDVSEKMPFRSNDFEKKSAADSILITPPKIKKF